MTLDPAGLEAAAKALERSSGNSEACDTGMGDCGGTHTDCWHRSRAADTIRAYLAAVVPVTPTTENPYPRGAGHGFNAQAWDEGFAAGRAAATETIPREDALQALHEMSTVAGLLRVRRDDPAVVALGDRLRLACRALRDVTAPGMNELMDSQPGRAAATPDPPRSMDDANTGVGSDQPTTFILDDRLASRLPAATPDPRSDSAYTCSGCDTIHVPVAAASPDERLREENERLHTMLGKVPQEQLARIMAATDRDKPEGER